MRYKTTFVLKNWKSSSTNLRELPDENSIQNKLQSR